MPIVAWKLVKKSKYRYVALFRWPNGALKWAAYGIGLRWRKNFDSEYEAALGADKRLIELKRPPVNVLKKIGKHKTISE